MSKKPCVKSRVSYLIYLLPVDSICRSSARRAYHKNCSLTLWPSLHRKAVRYNCSNPQVSFSDQELLLGFFLL